MRSHEVVIGSYSGHGGTYGMPQGTGGGVDVGANR
eukprot:SAG31_NODE_21524_length_547_cov_0.946429_1_plen_34_part_01